MALYLNMFHDDYGVVSQKKKKKVNRAACHICEYATEMPAVMSHTSATLWQVALLNEHARCVFRPIIWLQYKLTHFGISRYYGMSNTAFITMTS